MSKTTGDALSLPSPGSGRRRVDPFLGIALAASATIMAFILLPLVEMVVQPSVEDLRETWSDPDVIRAIGMSLYTSATAALIAFVFGTPIRWWALPF